MQTAKVCIFCFWKPQKQFDLVKGVTKTEVGYIGGNKQNLTYEEVCSGQTGACEAVIIEFDENIISYEEIIRHFFSFHKPEQLDGIDPNIGSSYRSHIYTFNSEQKKIAEKMLNEINQKLNKKVVTKISDGTQVAYSKAEEYHQKYYLKKPQ